MITPMSRVLALAAVLSLVSCATPPAQSGGGGEVVAHVGDKAITMQQVEDRWRSDDAGEHAEISFKMFEGRRKALEGIVGGMLFAEAAKGKGLSPEAYEEAEISRRVTEVTQEEVASFYAANIRDMQGQPLPKMAPLIARFLTEQKRETARREVLAELRKSGPSVQVLLEAPRYAVPVAETDPQLGNPKAPVTIVEFSDFQCPYCQRAAPTLRQLHEKYGDKVRVVWKDFPLTRIHPEAHKAAEAAHCAGDQGKYWAFHDRLFANQQALDIDALRKYARETSLDASRFDACLDSAKFIGRVREGLEVGAKLGVSSTPTIFINGRVLPGAYAYEDMAAVVDAELERLNR